jgi:uncharacterized protein with PIN domain
VKLASDEMLQSLGRWLRAAGHDTAVAAPGMADADLLRLCAEEGRVLVTRDGHLAGHSGGVRALRLDSDDPDAQARALRTILGLDWLHAPFTRCMVDNTPLAEADPQALAAMPEAARSLPGPHRVCPECGRAYWPGSHVRRMQARLAAWADGQPFSLT